MDPFRRRARSLSLLLTISAGLAGLYWWRVDVRAPTNIVIITLDTTRADRLSPYGYMDASMPALERLAREGVIFDRALTVAPLTLPAHSSVFTGLFPPRHGVRDIADRALASNHTTLAETLRAHGFRTGAFVSSVVLASDRGLAQGFDRYVDVPASDDRRPRQLQRRGDELRIHCTHTE